MELLIICFSSRQDPVTTGSWSEKIQAGNSCRWSVAQREGEDEPSLRSLPSDLAATPCPDLASPVLASTWAAVPSRALRGGFLPLPSVLVCQHLSTAGAKLCYCWGKPKQIILLICLHPFQHFLQNFVLWLIPSSEWSVAVSRIFMWCLV